MATVATNSGGPRERSSHNPIRKVKIGIPVASGKRGKCREVVAVAGEQPPTRGDVPTPAMGSPFDLSQCRAVTERLVLDARFLSYASYDCKPNGRVTATESEEPRERRDFPLSQVALFLSRSFCGRMNSLWTGSQ
jgi:hypothetical protein